MRGKMSSETSRSAGLLMAFPLDRSAAVWVAMRLSSRAFYHPGSGVGGLASGAPCRRLLESHRLQSCRVQDIPEPPYLWGFNQLHLAVLGAVQDHHLSFRIAKHKHITISKVCLFNSFLQ